MTQSLHTRNLVALACAVVLGATAGLGQTAAALELTERQVKLGPELNIPAARKAAEDLFKLDAQGDEPIYLIIDVRSGFTPAALVLVDAIAAVKSKVHAVIHSEAIGAGAVVAIFCHKRAMFPNATLLFTAFQYDNEKTMKEQPPVPATVATTILERAYATVAKRAGLGQDELKQKANNGWYLTAAEAKKAGLVDEIVERVTWQELATELIEVKKTSTVRETRPLPPLAPTKKSK